VAAICYLVLAQNLQVFTKEQISKEFLKSSVLLEDMRIQFNGLFNHFLELCFDFNLMEILPQIQFVATFFIMEFNYEMPKTVFNNEC
jgi:hypothetical protein